MAEVHAVKINEFELNQNAADDSLRSKVSWRPARLGGTNFKAQNLKLINQKIVVSKSLRAKLFASVFLVPGFLVLFVFGPMAFLKGDIASGLFSMLWGAIFGGGGWFLFYERNFNFDKTAGVYFRGRKFKHQTQLAADQQGYLNTIHAIQLLSEQVTSSSNSGGRSYLSYELNLVFNDGERANVMDSGDANNVEKAAMQLANYLNVPVWKESD